MSNTPSKSAPSPFAATFLQEAAEQLALIEDIVLELESNPTDIETINRMFRIFHTIKGSGSMFGFDEVAAFTHHVESALDKVRTGIIPVSKELVDVILVSKDQISSLLQGTGESPLNLSISGAKIILRLEELLPKPPPVMVNTEAEGNSGAEDAPVARSALTYHISFHPEPGILTRGMDPAALLNDLRALGPCVITARTDAIPPLEQFTPEFCAFYWDIQLTSDCGINGIKDVFIFVEDESKITIETINAPVAPPAPVTVPVPLRVSQNDLDSDSDDQHPEIAPAAPPQPSTALAEPKADAVTGSAKTAGNRKSSGADGSVRVPSEKLDRLVNLVGELVINQSRLSQISARSDNASLSAPTEDLERLVAELRDIVLGIRMMPIGATFSRFKRLVRDLSSELDKEIDLVTEGEETELDKTVIDQLGDPLVHLIRNSIDHGIDSPEERLRNGKPRRGFVRLSAKYEGANVIIKIEDDGRGLNKQAIRAKAIEKNLISADKTLSDSELFNLIFLPGFSTAKKVTSVSGRGVGMDVVKRQIDALRGTVDIFSIPGQCTCITLTLPLTLAIIDGLLVEVNQEQFIIPMSSVMENVELTASQRATANGRNLLAVRGELIPYLRLRDIFHISGFEQELERVVIVSLGGKQIGIVVDRVIGSHQTVIQSLGKFYQNIEVVSGATIMGDGRVALILDLAGLVQFNEKQDRSFSTPLNANRGAARSKAA